MTTAACPPGMRWLVLMVALAACTHAPPAVLASRKPIAIALPGFDRGLIRRDCRYLVELPPLPAKRDLDRSEERTCRAHFTHVRHVLEWQTHARRDEQLASVLRLIHAAVAAGGDCRIDADALFGDLAQLIIRGCGAPPVEENMISWSWVAAVATTRDRRATALENLAILAWHRATRTHDVERWIEAGDRALRAMHANPADAELAVLVVDSAENALRLPSVPPEKHQFPAQEPQHLTPAQVTRIAHMLEQVTDGAAADRARVLRAHLVW